MVCDASQGRLHPTDMSMLRWMSHVSLRDSKSSKELLDRFQMQYIRSVMQRGRLRSHGHVERMKDNYWVKRCRVMEIEGNRGRGRPKKTWEQVTSADLRSSQQHGSKSWNCAGRKRLKKDNHDEQSNP